MCVWFFFWFFSILASATLHVAATAERSLANGKTSRLVWIHLIWSERSSAHSGFSLRALKCYLKGCFVFFLQ